MKRITMMTALLLLAGGCAATLTGVQKTEADLKAAEADKQRHDLAMTEAKRLAEEAKRRAETTRKAHGRAIYDDAGQKITLAESLTGKAEQQRRKACTFDPSLCTQAPPANTSSGAQANPDLRPGYDFYDVKIQEFALSQMWGISPRPVGWRIQVDADVGKVSLTIHGAEKVVLQKPNPWAPGCYRFTNTNVGPCPANPTP